MKNKPLILDQTRNLGDVISDGFVFIKRNYKAIGELFVILVLPVLIFGVYNLYFVFKNVDLMDPEAMGPFGLFGGFKFLVGYGFSVLGILLFYYVNFCTTICYVRNENSPPERAMIVEFMKANAGKYAMYFLLLFLLVFVAALLFGLLAFISPVLIFILVLPLIFGSIYLFPYLSILPLTYIEKDLSLTDAIYETFRLIKGEWWPTFGTILVTNIIGSFASYIFLIPIYIIMMIQMFGSEDPNSVIEGGSFWMSVILIVSIIVSTLILTYTISCVAIKYFDLSERKDHRNLRDKIDSIGQNDAPLFENEGEF